MELDSDASLWGDASDCSLSVLFMNDLSSKSEASVDPSNHRKDSHQDAHSGTLRVREIFFQERLEQGGSKRDVEIIRKK